MNDYLWLKIETLRYYNTLLKLSELGINVLQIEKHKEYILIKTTYKDYERIKKYLVAYKISIEDVTGLKKVKEVVNKYIVFTIASIISIVLLFMANNMIFRVDIKTEDKEIKSILESELESYDLKVLSFKKRHKKIEKIVNKIIDDNKDTIKWLEIKYDGLIMIVNVTKVVDEDKVINYKNCNIVSKSDAKISSLNVYNGVILKEINDYVLKGDVLISGSIMLNEEVKSTVCASGVVYGEVWYKANVSVPLEEKIKEYTGKNRYNIEIKLNDNKYKIFKSRLDKKENEYINLYKLDDFEINLVKEKEYVNNIVKLDENDAYNKAINKALEKVKLKLNKNEEITYQKVLKKEVNDSKIYIEVFIVTKESIGELQIVEE